MNFYCGKWGNFICFVVVILRCTKQIHYRRGVKEKFTPSLGMKLTAKTLKALRKTKKERGKSEEKAGNEGFGEGLELLVASSIYFGIRSCSVMCCGD